MTETRELLFSFFTRDNPTGDSWISKGFGPTKRSFAPEFIGVKNYDSVLDTRKIPLNDGIVDFANLLKGSQWIEACKKYFDGIGREMFCELPVGIKPRDMPQPMLYVQDLNYGPGHSPDYEDLFSLKGIPKEMVFGTFAPLNRCVPWEQNSKDISMGCNGGVLFKDNRRGSYCINQNSSSIFLLVPAVNSLLGDMSEGYFNSGGDIGLTSGSYDFPRTHFLEWVFTRHCPDSEPNPLPGIRIELNPAESRNSTFEREAKWIKNLQSKDGGRSIYEAYEDKIGRERSFRDAGVLAAGECAF